MTHHELRSPSRLHHRRLVRYLLVGSVSFFLDVGGIWLAYQTLNLPIGIATTMGFIAGLTFNFTASKLFTFEVRSDTRGQTVRYIVLLGVNYLLTLIIVSSSEIWGPGYLAGKFVSGGLMTCLNYFALQHWVFAVPSLDGLISPSGLTTDNTQDIRK